MTEQQARELQIEIKVEKWVDRLDAQYLADNSTMTEVEYKAQLKAIGDWADQAYRFDC